jgi:hypothetical protein
MRLAEVRDQIMGVGLSIVSNTELLAVIMGTGHMSEAFDVAPDFLSEGLFGLDIMPVSELISKWYCSVCSFAIRVGVRGNIEVTHNHCNAKFIRDEGD